MGMPQQKEYRLEELEKYYIEIEHLYDLAEDFIATAEASEVDHAQTQIALVEPLINEITDATDVLTEEFISLARGARQHSNHTASKTRIESAMRRIYMAMNEYKKRSARVYKKANSRLRDITDQMVDAVQEHVERVIAIFVEFIQLSLESIMHKAELDMLFQRQQKLALQMHGLSQQSQ